MKLSYNKYHFIGIFITIAILISGCDLFRTREPDTPDAGRTDYQPPTTPNIVLINLTSSFKNKNVENYISCFSENLTDNTNKFLFVPSADAQARYAALFSGWSIDYERRVFMSMITGVLDGQAPNLVLNNGKFDVILPDSAVYESDYLLQPNNKNGSVGEIYSGTLQFTLKPENSGLWSIHKWLDASSSINDSTGTSWSILKAILSN
jgi:hypothetical protein